MITVGKEAFCDFQTLQAAVDYVEKEPASKKTSITILDGTYHERVIIQRSDLTLRGVGSVVLTYACGALERDESGQPLGTFRTATLFIGGSRNLIENITVQNTAGFGEIVGQALAVYADCDETTFRNCSFWGYQDTLFTGGLPAKQKDGTDFVTAAHSKEKQHYRQYYENCLIAGSVDFIFGGATAWFNHCEIHSRKEGIRNSGYVTAASTPAEQAIGFVFTNCWLTAEAGVTDIYLGRPWRPHAKTWFSECHYGAHIHPAGWHDWSKQSNQATVDYSVYAEDKIVEKVFPERVAWGTWTSNGKKSLSNATIFPGSSFYINKD